MTLTLTYNLIYIIQVILDIVNLDYNSVYWYYINYIKLNYIILYVNVDINIIVAFVKFIIYVGM